MKHYKHIKLFEDFIKEEDPLAGITGGGEEEGKEKKEEDPIKKMQDEEKKKKEKQEDKFDDFMEKKYKEADEVLKKYPEIKKEIGESVLGAIKSKDRVKIHNAVNDLIYLQVKYQKSGNTDKVDQISHVKNIVDELDKSFTANKMM